jgi:hypothetical protein
MRHRHLYCRHCDPTPRDSTGWWGGEGSCLVDANRADLTDHSSDGPYVGVLAAAGVGSGLIGGTFAPSLFLGATLGVFYQSVVNDVVSTLATVLSATTPDLSFTVPPMTTTAAETPAYALIGAAATLASVFCAPMTATLLVFELSRDYDLVLPLLAAAGTGPRVVELVRTFLQPPQPPPTAPPPPAATADAAAATTIATAAATATADAYKDPIQLVLPPDECATDDAPKNGACEEPPYVVLPEECDVDNQVASCLELPAQPAPEDGKS